MKNKSYCAYKTSSQVKTINGESAGAEVDRIIETRFIKIITVFPLLTRPGSYLILSIFDVELAKEWLF